LEFGLGLKPWNCKRRTIWIVEAHRDNLKRFIVRAAELLTAFLELESAIRASGDKRSPEVILD
jgi:hypothetical protein